MISAHKKKSSAASLDPEGTNVEVGDQVLVAGQKNGIVRFYGKTDFAPGVFPLLDLAFLKDLTRRCRLAWRKQTASSRLTWSASCRLLVWD